jgi:hypothetical protein
MTFGMVIAGLGGLALLGVGTGALVMPRLFSRIYGVGVTERSALLYVSAIGLRDIAIGVAMLAVVFVQSHAGVTALTATCVLIGLGDFVIAWLGADRRLRIQHVPHILGGIGFAILLAVLLKS